jgi:polar amino acid transport system permease protein
MIYKILLDELPYLFQGVMVVLELAVGLLALGLVVGLGLAIMEVYGNRIAVIIATIIDQFFRGVPAAVLLFLFYYGFSDFYNISSFAAAILALGLRSGAYQSQIFKGAILAVPEGQMVAARAVGMTKYKAIRHIILPQTLRHAIGPWSNEFSAELKATSLAYLIGVVELLRRGKYIVSYTYGNSLVVFSFCALIYLILTRLGNTALYRLENKLSVPGFEKRQIEG